MTKRTGPAAGRGITSTRRVITALFALALVAFWGGPAWASTNDTYPEAGCKTVTATDSGGHELTHDGYTFMYSGIHQTGGSSDPCNDLMSGAVSFGSGANSGGFACAEFFSDSAGDNPSFPYCNEDLNVCQYGGYNCDSKNAFTVIFGIGNLQWYRLLLVDVASGANTFSAPMQE